MYRLLQVAPRPVMEAVCVSALLSVIILKLLHGTAKDPRHRLMREKFILKSGSYNRGKDYYLVLADMEDPTKEYHRYKFEIDIAGI